MPTGGVIRPDFDDDQHQDAEPDRGMFDVDAIERALVHPPQPKFPGHLAAQFLPARKQVLRLGQQRRGQLRAACHQVGQPGRLQFDHADEAEIQFLYDRPEDRDGQQDHAQAVHQATKQQVERQGSAPGSPTG